MKFALVFFALCAGTSAFNLASMQLNDLDVEDLTPVLLDVMQQIDSAGDVKTHQEVQGMITLLDELKSKLEKEGKEEAHEYKFAKESLALFTEEVEIKNKHTDATIKAAAEDAKARTENIEKQKKVIEMVESFVKDLDQRKVQSGKHFLKLSRELLSQRKKKPKSVTKKSISFLKVRQVFLLFVQKAAQMRSYLLLCCNLVVTTVNSLVLRNC